MDPAAECADSGFSGKPYSDAGFELWVNPGTDVWSRVNTDGFGVLAGSNTSCVELVVLGDRLYAVASGTVGGYQVPHVLRYVSGTT